MNKGSFYKVVCNPPRNSGEGEKIYKATSRQGANNIGNWFVNVEWEGYSASYHIIPISEKEYKEIK